MEAGPGALLGLQRKWGAMTENTLTSVQVLTTICPFLTLVKIKTALIPVSRSWREDAKHMAYETPSKDLMPRSETHITVLSTQQ